MVTLFNDSPVISQELGSEILQNVTPTFASLNTGLFSVDYLLDLIDCQHLTKASNDDISSLQYTKQLCSYIELTYPTEADKQFSQYVDCLKSSLSNH